MSFIIALAPFKCPACERLKEHLMRYGIEIVGDEGSIPNMSIRWKKPATHILSLPNKQQYEIESYPTIFENCSLSDENRLIASIEQKAPLIRHIVCKDPMSDNCRKIWNEHQLPMTHKKIGIHNGVVWHRGNQWLQGASLFPLQLKEQNNQFIVANYKEGIPSPTPQPARFSPYMFCVETKVLFDRYTYYCVEDLMMVSTIMNRPLPLARIKRSTLMGPSKWRRQNMNWVDAYDCQALGFSMDPASQTVTYEGATFHALHRNASNSIDTPELLRILQSRCLTL